jgi:hypothetical protein
MEELCTFPLCGKSLAGVTDKVVSQMCPDVNYCSKECRRRDANENNHRSMALLIKYRKQELEKKRCGSQHAFHRPSVAAIAYPRGKSNEYPLSMALQHPRRTTLC